MKRKIIALIVLLNSIFSELASFGEEYLSRHYLSSNRADKIWSLNPSSLESYCAYQTLYRDKDSLSWIQRLTGCPERLAFSLAKVVSKVSIEANESFSIDSFEDQEVVRWLRDQFSFSVTDEEIDLGRELIFHEFQDTPSFEEKIAQYSLFLDVLALRARAIYCLRQGSFDHPSTAEHHKLLISAINTLLFEEIGIRYPSQREMFEEKFSLLSAVVSGKFGVCLGVSSLYLCLAQRLGIPLEIITPPGHIYLRYRDGSGEHLNIETTAGGCHYETERYEGTDSSGLKQRSLKEVLGLTFMNQGSFFLYAKNYSQAVRFYQKSQQFLKDPLLKELLAIAYILDGNEKEGERLLRSLQDIDSSPISICAQYLNKKIDREALAVVFSEPKEAYEDLLHYSKQLQSISHKYPNFLEAYRKLASVLLQLGRTKEALGAMEYCYQHDPESLSLVVSLCQLYLDRMDYSKAKEMLLKGEELSNKKQAGQHAIRKMRAYVSKVAP